MFHAVLHEWRRNYGSTRSPEYRPLCTYVRRVINGRVKTNYDLHYMNDRSVSSDSCSDVGFYVTKYMLKPSERERRLQQALHLNLDDEEYHKVWNLVKSRWFASEKFGYNNSEKVRSYIRKCVEDSKSSFDSPKFFNPIDGRNFPLGRYYLNRGEFFTIDDGLYFNKKKGIVDNVVMDDRHISDKLKSIDNFKKRVRQVDEHEQDFIFTDL